MIERQERGIDIACDRDGTQQRQHPSAMLAVKNELLYRLGIEMDFLYHCMVDRRILHNLHVLLVVEEQRIIALAHEEMLRLPVLLGQFLRFAVFLTRQGEMDALHL